MYLFFPTDFSTRNQLSEIYNLHIRKTWTWWKLAMIANYEIRIFGDEKIKFGSCQTYVRTNRMSVKLFSDIEELYLTSARRFRVCLLQNTSHRNMRKNTSAFSSYFQKKLQSNLLALLVYIRWSRTSLTITIVFLNSSRHEEIYYQQSKGFCKTGRRRKILRPKALHRLNKASFGYEVLKTILHSIMFRCS